MYTIQTVKRTIVKFEEPFTIADLQNIINALLDKYPNGTIVEFSTNGQELIFVVEQ